MADEQDFELSFVCSELEDDAFRVTAMVGRERISSPFEFQVTVGLTADVPLVFEDFDAILEGTATLAFGPEREHPIHGVVRKVTMHPLTRGDAWDPLYTFTFVPRLNDLRFTRGSWIYQDKTIEEIITAAFELGGDRALVVDDDFEFMLDGSYLAREYTVQYEESVLGFLSRQAEHWGIHYHFDHLAGTDRIIFADGNNHFPQLEEFEEIPFEGRDTGVASETIRAIETVQQMVESQISLREYNYRIPSVELVAPLRPVDALGVGDVHVTGDHFTTPDEGAVLARIRSQELFGRKRRMRAQTTVRGLRAGHRFAITGATPEAFGLAREYVVVGVEHRFEVDGSVGTGRLPYVNYLTLQPIEASFRPARVVAAPKIYGVMHAKIDAEAPDDFNVPVDEWGRYKVVMPFDVAGETGGKSSCWIRLSTPAGGGGWGFAQGLHDKIEVIIVHIDGDPDRPVIVGSVGNFEQPATVRQENANALVTSSRHGITMTFTDS